MTVLLDATDAQMARLADLTEGLRVAEQTIAGMQAARDGMLAMAAALALEIARAGRHPDHGDMTLRAVAAEIGAAQRVSDRTVERRMDEASWLIERFPQVWEAQGAGRISAAHARVIVDAGAHLDDPCDREGYAARVLAAAEVESPNRLRRIARRMAEEFQARSVDERHRDARELRRIWVKDLDDGMAELGMLGPAVLVHGMHDRLTQMAHALKRAGSGGDAAAGAGSRHDAAAGTGSTSAQTPDADADAGASAGAGNSAGDGASASAGASASTGAAAGAPGAGTGSAGTDAPNAGASAGAGNSAGADTDASAGAGADASAGAGADASDSAGAGAGGGAPGVPDERTMDQLRADLLADIVLTGAPVGHDTDAGLLGEIRARVEVTVPVLTLMDDHSPGSPASPPAELDGRSPIDSSTARLLAGEATGWERVLTHPISGALLAVDRYRPGEQLRRHLRARDQRCRFPACGLAARRCDIDHNHAASAGGATCADNLAHFCRRHHMLKHHSPWHVRQGAEGSLEWRSPSGRVYTDSAPVQNSVRFVPSHE